MCRVVSERREHRVFDTLLKSIPNLEERLMVSSEEEIAMIADLASADLTFSPFALTVSLDTERGLQRQIGRYQEPKECHY